MSDRNDIALLKPDQMLAKVVQDLYFGNSKPALTLRVAENESNIVTLRDAINENKDWQKSMNKLVIGTLISSVGGLIAIIVELIRH